ncbi:hypothetical protein KIV56_12235 [Cryobacterium breve]|uniref:Potassium transporter Trk n=1 Tax=Cryobacterium breve TaxID=1259258 RepID=A0ABY7NBT4_9MICO|nr:MULTISPECIES: hypothetical protein [Cryobacterium]MDY7542357.1 hypothetical protein [Cryobacterium sp. 5B3]MEA9999484.1 hypothetical protein [Cryobacterium sp. RTS3]MEB0267677.1 hypothetical protein [Cryobacterium sp. 10I5]MEB0275979.1 hypothetical protein [Cryobacterium sp. 5B3]WBM79222.1 hypothetical protein KIV56_12235 [Cryobacterium breve]
MSATEQPGNDIAPVQPAPGTAVPEILVGQAAATVRRSPRYLNFMIVGAVLGAVTALILTVGFPQTAEFGLLQVFGFLLLVGVVVGLALGALVAILIDRFTGRSVQTVVVDRLGVYGASVENAPAEADDPPTSSANTL